ncbi:MAG: hypothetical protein ACI91B_003229 [Planctomycetota bacterium]|jgi:hypothetical protein
MAFCDGLGAATALDDVSRCGGASIARPLDGLVTEPCPNAVAKIISERSVGRRVEALQCNRQTRELRCQRHTHCGVPLWLRDGEQWQSSTTLQDAVADLGKPVEIRRVFTGFHKLLTYMPTVVLPRR